MARPQKEAYELTDAEKRGLIELIQQGKNLPEKYRLVLFEDVVRAQARNRAGVERKDLPGVHHRPAVLRTLD